MINQESSEKKKSIVSTSSISSHLESIGDDNEHPSKRTIRDGLEKQSKVGKQHRIRNSYLKVMLDEEVFIALYSLSISIRDIIKDSINRRQQNSDFQTWGGKLSFQPRSVSSLHMTFFFGGEVLTTLPQYELKEWHGQLVTLFGRVSSASITKGDLCNEKDNGCDTEIDGNLSQKKDLYVTFRELTLFPPRRNNLIVAIFDVSKSMNILHDDVRNIALKGNSTMLSNVVQRSKEKWTAHITLGNIRQGTKPDLKRLRELLSSTCMQPYLDPQLQSSINTKLKDLRSDSMKVRGIEMGGPCPDQLPLDWMFPFK